MLIYDVVNLETIVIADYIQVNGSIHISKLILTKHSSQSTPQGKFKHKRKI